MRPAHDDGTMKVDVNPGVAAQARAEIEDSFDEELELELDDERLGHLLDDSGESAAMARGDAISRSCSACRANW